MKGDRIFLKTTITATVMISLTMIISYYNKGYDVITKFEGYCRQDKKEIILKNIIPLEWDTLYIVSGPSLSEFLEWDYNLKSEYNRTAEDGISLYFVLNKEVIYIENNDGYKKRRGGERIYIKFEDNNIELKSKKRSTASAIYYQKTILKSEGTFNSFDPDFKACKLIPINQ